MWMARGTSRLRRHLKNAKRNSCEFALPDFPISRPGDTHVHSRLDGLWSWREGCAIGSVKLVSVSRVHTLPCRYPPCGLAPTV